MEKKDLKKILTKKKPEKKLLLSLKKKAGRGPGGRITIRHRGGGTKKLYRIVDFGEEKMDMLAKAIAIEYDPYRASFLCLLEYEDKEKRYRICPQGLKVGDGVICSEKAEIKTGNRMKLKNIPVGTQVYNVELEPQKGGKLVRGAGTAARILAHEGKFCHLVFPSSETRQISEESFASVGQVSNPEHRFVTLKKAGSKRYLGKRPTVRGTAMGPADHPHGGGEGRAPIGLPHPKTPWGKPALGVKTRKKKWTDKFIIQRRKKKK
jgi:large subunit ribosomal protein L2